MIRLGRIGTSTRAFCLAALLGLSLALRDPIAVQSTILLTAVGATAVAADEITRLRQSWVTLAEGFLAAALIGVVIPHGFVLLPYLMVPALLAGVSAGVWPALRVCVAEAAALAVFLVSSGPIETAGANAVLVAPWLLTSIGLGLLGAWLRRLRGGLWWGNADPSYESARRLLSQLRTVARRLSSGLDPVSMASQILVITHQYVDDSRSGLFVSTDGGVLTPMGYRGGLVAEELQPVGQLVDRCWSGMEPALGIQASGVQERRQCIVLPLRSDSHMIGVVIAEAAVAPSAKTLASLMVEIDEQALRLDTALVFDEVRALATTEERKRLAREIHDGVAQEIASLGYLVDDLSAKTNDPKLRKGLNGLRRELTRVVNELRLSIFDLRSEINPSAGLGSALSDYVRTVGARSGMTVHLTLDEAPTRLRGEVETELLRIAQEAITNARKHSGARNLWVNCQIKPPFARIHVQDDGSGLGTPRDDSYGLRIMRERAKRISAALDIGDQKTLGNPDGTSVTVTVGAGV
jgi:signal transduction histidine kinase